MGKFHVVELEADHPGFNDLEYRHRRDFIALESEKYDGSVGSIPLIEYTETEKEVWRFVAGNLKKLNDKFSCEQHIEGLKLLDISFEQLPQLRDISEKMVKYTGFQMAPVAGLVPTKEFLESFATNIFPSTQYLRHHSQPGFTPEPDMVHDALGHSGGLCDHTLTDIVREIGLAAALADEQTLKQLERVYWFTIEYGLIWEGKKLKTFGAGNLSSFIDIQRCIEAKEWHRPFYIEEVINTPYDPTIVQETLFIVDSLADCLAQVRDFCRSIKQVN